MSEYIKGKMTYTIEKKRGWRTILRIKSQDILHGCTMDVSEANAAEIVRRWNAFEENDKTKEQILSEIEKAIELLDGPPDKKIECCKKCTVAACPVLASLEKMKTLLDSETEK